MQRNRQLVAAVLDVVDIAGRDKRHDRSGRTHVMSGYNQMRNISIIINPVIDGLILLAAMDAHHAPGNVVVNRSRLIRQPNERCDGEAAIRLHMENVLPIAFACRRHLLRGKEVAGPEVRPE